MQTLLRFLFVALLGLFAPACTPVNAGTVDLNTIGAGADPIWSSVMDRDLGALALADLSEADGASLDLGETWTLQNKNTGGNALTALDIVAAGLQFDMGVANSAPGVYGASASGSVAVRRLFSDFDAALITEPRTRLRFAAAFATLGDENTELVGIGWHNVSNMSQTGYGGTVLYTGWSGGAAKVVGHHITSTGSGTAFAVVTGTYDSVLIEYTAGNTFYWWGTATAGEPPDILDEDPTTAGWVTVNGPLAGGGRDWNAAGTTTYGSDIVNKVLFVGSCTQNTDGDAAPVATWFKAAVDTIQ
jgi:hypothetical protein